MTRWAYEFPDGLVHIIDDGGFDEPPAPVGSVLCVDGTAEHEWDEISSGMRCSTCELTIITTKHH